MIYHSTLEGSHGLNLKELYMYIFLASCTYFLGEEDEYAYENNCPASYGVVHFHVIKLLTLNSWPVISSFYDMKLLNHSVREKLMR